MLVYAVSLAACPGFGQTTTTKSGILRLQFLDSRTGAAVRPSALLLDGNAVSQRADESGLLSMSNLADGSHEIQVEAVGYHGFNAMAAVDRENTLVQTFELDPVPQAQDDITTPSADECVVHGYVVDDFRGTRLPDTHLSVEHKNSNTVSDKNGRYVLRFTSRVLKSGGEVAGSEHVNLKAEHEGYRKREFRNVEAPPGSRVMFPVRLQRLEDVNVADESTSGPEVVDETAASAGGHRTYDWVFDVTLR